MMTSKIVMLVLVYVLAIPTAAIAINALNRMDRHTSHGIRVAYILLAFGAMSAILSPIFGKPISWTTVLLLGGVLVLNFSERRHSKLAKA